MAYDWDGVRLHDEILNAKHQMLVIARKWRDARKGTDLEHTTELAEQLMDAIDTVDFWQRKLVEHNGI